MPGFRSGRSTDVLVPELEVAVVLESDCSSTASIDGAWDGAGMPGCLSAATPAPLPVTKGGLSESTFAMGTHAAHGLLRAAFAVPLYEHAAEEKVLRKLVRSG